ncbi:MAG: hypothetical protein WBC06_08605, partial [Chitinophagaceae bacterium]
MGTRFFLSIIFVSVLIMQSCSKKGGTNPPPSPTPTVPGCATNTAPANGTFVSAGALSLTWTAVSGATGYDVYLGTTASSASVIAS